MIADALHTMHELDRPHADGIHVRLLWHPSDDRVAVAVADTKAGDAFVIAVRNGERALEVFHHPYAYAAWHGIDTRGDSEIAGVALAAA